MCVCVCLFVCASVYTCIYVCMYVCVYVCMYACMYVCMYAHTHTHTHTYTCTHTHITQWYNDLGLQKWNRKNQKGDLKSRKKSNPNRTRRLKETYMLECGPVFFAFAQCRFGAREARRMGMSDCVRPPRPGTTQWRHLAGWTRCGATSHHIDTSVIPLRAAHRRRMTRFLRRFRGLVFAGMRRYYSFRFPRLHASGDSHSLRQAAKRYSKHHGLQSLVPYVLSLCWPSPSFLCLCPWFYLKMDFLLYPFGIFFPCKLEFQCGAIVLEFWIGWHLLWQRFRPRTRFGIFTWCVLYLEILY